MVIVQALVTALLSGLFSGAIIFALNERRDRTNLILTKVEVMLEHYFVWTELLSRLPVSHFDMFRGDRAEARETLNKLRDEAQAAFLKARLLQSVYLPAEGEAFMVVMRAERDLIPAIRISTWKSNHE